MEEIHLAIEQYSKAKGYNMLDFCWEVYQNQPGEVEDAGDGQC